MLQNHEKIIYKYHEHQSLLENKEEEGLNEEERKAAWEEFENEKKNRFTYTQYNNTQVMSKFILHINLNLKTIHSKVILYINN